MKAVFVAIALLAIPVSVTAQFSENVDLRTLTLGGSSFEHINMMPTIVDGVDVGGTDREAIKFPDVGSTTIGVAGSKLLPYFLSLSPIPTVVLEFVWWKPASDGYDLEDLLIEVRIRGEHTSCDAWMNLAESVQPLGVAKGSRFKSPMTCTSVGEGPNALMFYVTRGRGRNLGHRDNYLLGMSISVLP